MNVKIVLRIYASTFEENKDEAEKLAREKGLPVQFEFDGFNYTVEGLKP